MLNRLTATQWLVPETATILENRVGSAPLMVFNKESQLLASMPGVPYEMKIAMEEQILPYISRQLSAIRNQNYSSYAASDGYPGELSGDLLEDYENEMPSTCIWRILPKDGIIRLRLSSYGE